MSGEVKGELPVVELSVADVLALFAAALEREDLEAADRWAALLLRRNDFGGRL